MTSTNLPPPPTPPLTSSVPASSTKPSAPRKTSSNAFRTCMTDGIASAWSTRREATIKRPPIATAKSSTSFAPTPTTTMRASTRCSSSSSKNSNPPRAECSPGRKPIWLPNRAQYPKASYPRLSHTEIPKLRFRSQIAWPWSLPRGGRQVLLFRTAQPDRPARRPAAHPANCRDLPRTQARRQPCQKLAAVGPHYGQRAYAEVAPALCEHDAANPDKSGRKSGRQYGNPRRAPDARSSAPRTGLPRGLWDSVAGQTL